MKKNNIKAGIIFNYLFIAVSNICSLLIVPVFRNGLGDQTYGVYLLAVSVFTFFAVSDYHIGTAFITEIARRNKDEGKKTLGTYVFGMLPVYSILAVLMSLVCVGVAEVYPLLFRASMSGTDIDLFRNMLRFMSLNCFLLFFQNYLFSIITGLGFLVFTRVCNIIKIILRTALLMIFIAGGHGPVAVVFGDIILTFVIIITFILFIVYVKAPFSVTGAERGLFRKNLLSIIMLYAMPLLDNLYWAYCIQLVGRKISPEAVVEFNIALVFCQVFIQMSATLSHLRMGEIAEIDSLGDKGRMRDHITGTGILQAICLGFILIGFAAFGKTFISLWLGKSMANGVYPIALIMMCAMFLPLSHAMLEIELYVKKGYHLRTFVFAVMTASNMVAATAFIRLGPSGAAWAIALTMTLFGFGLMNVMYEKAGIPSWKYTAEMFGKIGPPLLASFSILLLIRFLKVESLAAETALSFIPAILFMLLVYLISLTGHQRTKLKETILKTLHLW